MRVLVQDAPFDLAEETARFAKGEGGSGAIVTFTGVVRDNDAGTLSAMEIEHYPGMTEKALSEIAQQAVTRFDLQDALVIHRHGRLVPGEQIMMVATPFWKREITSEGEAWVAAKDEDEAALERW